MSYDYTELRASVSWRDILQFALSVAPDFSVFSRYGPVRDRIALAYEAGARYPLSDRLNLTAGAGHHDLTEFVGTGYWYFNAGAELQWGRAALSLGYVGTEGGAARIYHSRFAGDRLVAAIILRLD